MFIGHLALGFGAKKVAPMLSLGTLFLAAQWADVLWPFMVAAGWELVSIEPGITVLTPLNFISYPYSHSLVALVGWAALFAIVYRVLRGSRVVAIATLAVLVISHWVLDVVTHRADMPVTINGDAKLGLGLWNHPFIEIPLEVLMYIGGVALYLQSTRARSRAGTIGAWTLIVFLLVVYFAALFGPPPPSVEAIKWSAVLPGLLLVWAYWLDRQRRPAD